MKFWKLVSVTTALVLSSSANASIIHSNNFKGPLSSTFTTVYGNPEFVDPTEIFNTRSLAFNTSENNQPCCYYDQISYQITPNWSPSYNVSFDIYTDSLIGSNNQFAILFDTPSVRNLYFTNEGTIDIHGGGIYQQVLTTYNENESMHIDMLFDLSNNVWNVSLDDIAIYSGVIDYDPYRNPAEYLSSIRFSQGLELGTNTPSHNATVYLDNLVISSVPIPAAVWLFGSGLIGLVGVAKRKKSQKLNNIV